MYAVYKEYIDYLQLTPHCTSAKNGNSKTRKGQTGITEDDIKLQVGVLNPLTSSLALISKKLRLKLVP